MSNEFPLGQHWSAELFASVLPPSKFGNIFPPHAESVTAQVVRAVLFRNDSLALIIQRVNHMYNVLDRAFELAPIPIANIVYDTFGILEELQQREFSIEHKVNDASKDDLESKFGSHLELYEFTYERFYRTLTAPYVVANSIVHPSESRKNLVEADGRSSIPSAQLAETELSLPQGTLTMGLNNHLRNAAAHHRYSILTDNCIKLWDVAKNGKYTWGPVEWTLWELRTNVCALSNTCSSLLLGLAMFDISHSPTIRHQGIARLHSPRPKRRDIVKSELNGMADLHGFFVDRVDVGNDGALQLNLRVIGESLPDQIRQIMSGGGNGPNHLYFQKVTTLWNLLRDQVYGFLQMTLDAHGGYEIVRINVVDTNAKDQLGEVEAPLSERQAMWQGKEKVDTIRVRLPVDTLQDKKIPIIVKGPVNQVR